MSTSVSKTFNFLNTNFFKNFRCETTGFILAIIAVASIYGFRDYQLKNDIKRTVASTTKFPINPAKTHIGNQTVSDTIDFILKNAEKRYYQNQRDDERDGPSLSFFANNISAFKIEDGRSGICFDLETKTRWGNTHNRGTVHLFIDKQGKVINTLYMVIEENGDAMNGPQALSTALGEVSKDNKSMISPQ